MENKNKRSREWRVRRTRDGESMEIESKRLGECGK